MKNKKKILIALCGMSPAVITETVYAMNNEKNAPDKVVVITTTIGRERIKKELISSGVWNQLSSEIKGSIEFSDSAYHIRLIPNSTATGDALDIVTTEDNIRTADFVLDTLREFTENPETQITFSIAGGRKTMSSIGAMAMSLLGRENDKLCHVLVNEPFDSPALVPKFYFPVPDIIHKALDGNEYKSTDAQITLCYLPFVQVRYLFQDEFNRLPGGFNSTVELANERISGRITPPDITVIPERMEVFINNKLLRLNCGEFIMYWMLVEAAKNSSPPFFGQASLYEEYMDFAANISMQRMPEFINHQHIILKKDEGDLRKNISFISTKIKNLIPVEEGREYAVPSISRGVYGISVPPDHISIH